MLTLGVSHRLSGLPAMLSLGSTELQLLNKLPAGPGFLTEPGWLSEDAVCFLPGHRLSLLIAFASTPSALGGLRGLAPVLLAEHC